MTYDFVAISFDAFASVAIPLIGLVSTALIIVFKD